MSSLKDVITNPSVTVNLLKKYNIRPSKKLGQSFLVDTNIAKKIIQSADIKKDDIVLEIGPGIGALTQLLARTGAFIEAIEIDKKLVKVLKDNLQTYPNVTVSEQDAMHLDKDSLPKKPNKLVANLPYSVASPLLINYLNNFENIESFIVMVQKEVAERILASCSSRNYSTLTVKLNLMAEINKVAQVSPNVFIPRPKVESAVIKLMRKPQQLIKEDRVKFFKLVNAAFSERRKKIANSLASALKLERSYVESILTETSIESSKRAEQLCLEDYLRLFQKMKKSIPHLPFL